MAGAGRARWSPQWVVAIAAASVLLVLGVLGRLTGAESAAVASIGSMNVVAALFTAMGALVLSYVPGHLVGRLLVAAGVAAIVEVVALDLSGWLPLAWLSQWAWWPPLALTFIALLVFPDGHLASGGWRVLAGVLVLSATATAVALAIAAVDYPRTLVTSMPSGYPARTQLLLDVAAAAGAVSLLSLFGVLWSLWLRWRHAEADRRQQLSCVLAGVFLLVLGLGLDIANVPGGWALYTLALPLTMTVAVLRYHLYDLDRVINRGLVWLLMTLLVIAGFVGLVTVLR